jgi:hypothetical protein
MRCLRSKCVFRPDLHGEIKKQNNWVMYVGKESKAMSEAGMFHTQYIMHK